MNLRRSLLVLVALTPTTLLAVAVGRAEPPSASYMFPAGGQRGTSVPFRVGGHYLHDQAQFDFLGPGVTASQEIIRTERIWFEGPLIRQPASQQSEDYPQDYAGEATIAADAPLGRRTWRASNAQGVTAALPFIVGDLPEVVEQETDGQPIPTSVQLPVTVNGRIFPRQDIDIWTIAVAAGQTITCGVAAAELGSPLETRLEVRDPSGSVIAESGGGLRADPQLRFTSPQAGEYAIQITDSRSSGAQHFVYRLSIVADVWIDRIYPLGGRRGQEITFEAAGQGIAENRFTARVPDTAPGIARRHFEILGKPRNVVLLDVDELDESLEPAADPLPTIAIPAVANGRIEQPGDVDAWPLPAGAGKTLKLEVRAARLGSPLDAVLTIRDGEGKELARAEDLPSGSPDCELDFTPPTEGMYTAEVSERFASRGGPAFAYRLRVTRVAPDFQLSLTAATPPPADALLIDVGAEKKLTVNVLRTGGYDLPVTLSLAGLPPGVSAPELTVAPNENKAEFTIKVEKTAPVQLTRLQAVGRSEGPTGAIERRASIVPPSGEALEGDLLLACTLPTPFRLKSQYELRYVARGGTLRKSFRVERNGYEGPLEVQLADRQNRHLQGVTGPVVTVPAGATDFEYRVFLPPWMELGRTSRSNLMLTGEVADVSGKMHKVSFYTADQNEQLIALISPAPLRLSLAHPVMAIEPGQNQAVTVRIHRDRTLAGACTLELIVPAHMRQIAAEPVIAAPDAQTIDLHLRLGDQPGPLNMPLSIRATVEKDGAPIIAETDLELVYSDD